MKKAVALVDSQSTISKPQHPQRDARTDGSPARGTGTSRRSEYESQESDSSWTVTHSCRRTLWDPQAGIDNLPLGKRQVMDKFFAPVHSLRHEETQSREPYPCAPHQSHHNHQHQDYEIYGCSTPGSSNRGVNQSHVHRQPHGHHTPVHLDHPQDHTHRHSSPHRSRCSDTSPCSHAHDLAPVASSPRACSCTCSSTSSWSSEASMDKDAFLMDSRPGPRHSQSCNSIPAKGQGFWDAEEGVHLEGLEGTPPRHQHCRDDCVRKLHRGQSKSDEGLPCTNSSEDVRPLHLDHNPLYKSASLGRSLAFNDYTEILPDSEKPKKTPSSDQLPSKGILKNRHGQGGAVGGVSHFRKAKSLEVLSTRVEITTGGLKGGRSGVGKSKLEDAGVEERKAAARQHFVQEKLQFSAFLNEITRQVISPSRLSSLGVPDASVLPCPGQAVQKPSRKEPRAEAERQEQQLVHRQQKDRSGTPDSVVSSGHSHSSKYSHSSKHHHSHRHSSDGSSQQQHHTPEGPVDASTNSPEHCHPPARGQSHRGEKQHQGGYTLLPTDGTNTSPELSPHVPRRHHSHAHSHVDRRNLKQHHKHHHQPHPEKYQRCHADRSPSPHSPCPPKTVQTSHTDSNSGVLGQESDSSQNKDTASTTSTSLEHSDKICNKAAAVQHQDAVTDVDRPQSLQEQNEELRHSLLQTVVRMECMEAELQKTQEELNSVKDSFNRLQENSSSTEQSNKLLEQKLHTMVQSMGTEQTCLIQRISELSKELTAAQSTIFSLRTVNIPSLLQELLDKHFQHKGAVTESLRPVIASTQFNDTVLDQALVPGDRQSPALGHEGEERRKNQQQGSGESQRRAKACQPWKREQDHQMRLEGDRKGSGDTEYEKEGGKSLPSSLLIPHLLLTQQKTSPSNTLSIPVGGGHGVIPHPMGGLTDILLVCPEESNSSVKRQQCHQDLRPDMSGPAATMQNFPSPEGGDQRHSVEDEMMCRWRLQNSREKVGVSRNSLENEAIMVTCQSAQRMLDNFMHHPPPPEEREEKGSDRGVATGPKEKSLNGERKQL